MSVLLPPTLTVWSLLTKRDSSLPMAVVLSVVMFSVEDEPTVRERAPLTVVAS